jgi:Trm5-related predicted tRNA methylase
MSKYPRVGSVLSKKKNTSAKCRCGEVGKYKTTVQVDIFRGDDEVFWSCSEHKNDCVFLLGGVVDSQGAAQ